MPAIWLTPEWLDLEKFQELVAARMKKTGKKKRQVIEDQLYQISAESRLTLLREVDPVNYLVLVDTIDDLLMQALPKKLK